MIVVVGNPTAKASPAGIVASGPAALVALSAAAAGSEVQLVARVVDDPAGDSMLQHLTTAGVSHVATLRQPATPDGPVLEAADLELALRYLTNVGVLVLAGHDPGLTPVAVEAAAWNHAALVVHPPARAQAVPTDLPTDATVLAAPESDPDGAFGSLVGAYAAALDRGVDAATAFKTTITAAGDWSRRSPTRVSVAGGHQRLDERRGRRAGRRSRRGPPDRSSSSSSSFGTRSPSSSPGSAGAGPSQRSQASSGSTTGIRSCRSRSASFGVVVTIVKVRRTVSVAGSRQPAHRPASASGRPSLADHPVRLADRALALPLVERVDRHEAATPLERSPEGRAGGQRLGTGVEHPGRDLRLGRPVRDEAPAVGRDGATVLALDDHRWPRRSGRRCSARPDRRRAAPPRRSRPAPTPAAPG